MEEMSVGIAQRSYMNLPSCGDQCGCWNANGRTVLAVADGLGHGPEAETVARAAIEYIGRMNTHPLAELFHGCDHVLKGSRGAVVSVAAICHEKKEMTYAGVGNIIAQVVRHSGGSMSMAREKRVSGNSGIVGSGIRKLSPVALQVDCGDLIVLATDGIREAFSVLEYDISIRLDSQRLARQIVKDWSRPADDALVMVYRI